MRGLGLFLGLFRRRWVAAGPPPDTFTVYGVPHTVYGANFTIYGA